MGLLQRRMTLVVENCFTDIVTHRAVNLYQDRKGVYWFANDLSYFGMRSICEHPDTWKELDARRKIAMATLPPHSRPY